ncbi:ATP-binding protein [Streptomyces pristinaespiralis]|uniref:ATP-binding protein n=1 Tax=Streptomyces pristinaespiralis TaxID=38300 RepID=UPI0033C3E09A
MLTVSPPWTYSLQLPQDPRAPRIARHILGAVLRAHHLANLSETAELLVSELVTNAFQHTDGAYGLRLRSPERGRLRLGVWDTHPDIPPPFAGLPRRPAPEATGGRGLCLVAVCADAWGATALPQGGKLLWVELGGAR